MVGKTGLGAPLLVSAARHGRPAGKGSWRCTWCLACAAGAAVAAPPGQTAAALEDSRPGWLQLETSLRVTPEVLESRWTSLVRRPGARPDYALAPASAPPPWSNVALIGRIVEWSASPPSGRDAQTMYVRPQFALGNSSEALRGWLRRAGIEAATCTAPLMKMHSSFAGSTTRANVSLSARCSVP